MVASNFHSLRGTPPVVPSRSPPMFTLLDGEVRHALYPISFHIPSLEERQGLTPGVYVKLGFQESDETERAWVEVTAIDGDQVTGIVCNDLVVMTSVKDGDAVAFQLKHIIGIYHGE